MWWNYLCLLPVDCQNFMNARGRPGPPVICLAKSAMAPSRRMKDSPAVATWREKMPCTELEVLVMVILPTQQRMAEMIMNKKY